LGVIHRNQGARSALIHSPNGTSMKLRKTLLALLLALCAPLFATAAPASAGTKAPGIDVSRFQRTIDWPTVAGSGIRFAFVQAARGNGTDCSVKPNQCGGDPFYAINYANAKAAGIRVGPYHRAFATGATRAEARADAISEADVYLATVGTLTPGDLLPVLDVESPFTGLTANRLRTWVRVWLKRVRARLGVKPMIYTNATSWGATGDTREFAKARYPLWVAQWGVSKPSVPAGNWAGRGYSVWQYTSSGTVPGISGRVDLDRLRVGLAKITIH
jgi:GH25 family lysozyme M1 (1,4-beta-N-acetylmuramidase)